MFLKNKKAKLKNTTTQLYHNIVEQARLPIFYRELSVEDSIDKRFEMIVIHMFIVLNVLKNSNNNDIIQVSQMLFDTMFEDMEASLREQGIGDMGIPRRVKKMINKFYDRIFTYERAIQNKSVNTTVNEILYGNSKKTQKKADIIGNYIIKQINNISSQKIQDLMIGAIFWSKPNI